ncbi:MAG: GntR family transcriptional regulator [Proteobacteria bacterium]|nr:GntR family transcriptional regulator [Pseudomonadota bacterium]MCP4922372.1 GntR family transcriptional regulator [Pseudomonadota bacterium]
MLDRRTLPEQTADRIRTQIVSGELPPGARLPPERELAVELGVNRMTLRTALSRLVATGLIEQVQGRGTIVLDVSTGGGPDLLPTVVELAQQHGELKGVARELFRVRRHLARACLERLAEVQPDPAPVKAAVERFETAVDHAQADSEILAALVEAADSPVLGLCLNPIRNTLASLGPLKKPMYKDPQANLAGWRTLCQWLENPNPALIPMIVAMLEERDRATLAGLR